MIDPLSEVTKQEPAEFRRQLPIGVFDSGLGGLTVVKQICRQLPKESILYFGDTARVPYGTKSVETVQNFSLQIARFLERQGVKLIVVACNTASSVAIEYLRQRIRLPIVGVIEPGVRAALKVSQRGKIGVIGTTATIAAGRYDDLLKSSQPDILVESAACPLFVSLVEEGWIDTPVTEMVAREYLQPLVTSGIDTLILGCTHYPLIKKVIRRVIGDKIRIVDTAIETALLVDRILASSDLKCPEDHSPEHRFYVSDFPQKFEQTARLFLGKDLPNVERIVLDNPEE